MPANTIFTRRVLAKKLLISVVLLSSLITLIASGIQLYSNYSKGIKHIESEFINIEKVHMGSLTSSVWTSDLKEIRKQLDGMITIPNIKFLSVAEQQSVIDSAGKTQTENVITKQYPLLYTHRGTQHAIGTLTVQATLDNVYQDLLDQATSIIISNAIKTFLVGIFILYVFYNLVTRHLHQMASFTQQLDLHNLDDKLELKRSQHKQDELDIVVQGITKMQENLRESIIQLQEKEIRFRQLVESSTAIPWQLDLDTWRFTYVGPQAFDILGYPVEEWYKENFWQDHIHPDDREQAIHYCVTSSNQGKDHEFEYRMLDSNNQPVWIRDDVQVISKNGKPAVIHGYMFDITQRKNAEIELQHYQNQLQTLVKDRTRELETSNHELEAFCYSVSHDLRAPLRSISSFSQIILEEYQNKLDEDGLNYLHRVVKGCKNMSEIIEALLSLSRVTRRPLEKQNVDLSELCQKAFDQQKEAYPERQVEIKLTPNLLVNGDNASLSILMNNLMENAWKYTQQKPNSMIEFGKTETNGQINYFIRDNGIGFDPQYINKLFLPFHRLHTDSLFEGTGIGLATVQRIINRHDGKVWAESEPGQGATFWFTLNDNSNHLGKQ